MASFMTTRIYVPIETKMSFSSKASGLQKKLSGYTYEQRDRYIAQMRENEIQYFEELIDEYADIMNVIATMSAPQISVSKSFMTYRYAFPVKANMGLHGIMDLEINGDYLILTIHKNIPIVEAKAEVIARLQKTCVYYMDEINNVKSKSYPYIAVDVNMEESKELSKEDTGYKSSEDKKKNGSKAFRNLIFPMILGM